MNSEMEGERIPSPTATELDMDRYIADIEFSNSCRRFYISRLRATENFKQSLQQPCSQNQEKQTPHTSIDKAMALLKKEMASLMDQDLSLMKQLLTLNEAIQDLKGGHSLSKDSDCESSLCGSDWSVSETDMFGSDNGQFSNKIKKHNFQDQDVYDVENMCSCECCKLIDDSGCCSECSKLSTDDKSFTHFSVKCYQPNFELSLPGHPSTRKGARDSADSGYCEVLFTKEFEVTL